jgi:hypothetical protein
MRSLCFSSQYVQFILYKGILTINVDLSNQVIVSREIENFDFISKVLNKTANECKLISSSLDNSNS